MGLSLKPSEMQAGGGLWSDIDATITGAKFMITTFDGKVPEGRVVLELNVDDDAGEGHEQMLSCGNGKFTPSEDGGTLEGSGKINNGSNFGQFIISMVNAGFPENKLDDDIGILVGTKAHFERVAAPKRSGMTKAPRADGKTYEDTILVVTKILQLPWDAPKKGKAMAKVAGKPAAGKAAVKGTDNDVASEATDAVMEVLSGNPEGMTKQQLAKALFQVVKGNTNASAIVKMCYDEEFLGSGPWSFEDGVVSM